MDMANDKAVGESTHGITQDITTDCLHDILHEFWTIAFNPSPLSIGGSFIGHAVRAELIYTHSRLYIREPSAGWKIDKEHTALVVDMETVCVSGSFIDHSLFDSCVYRPPECSDIGIGRLTALLPTWHVRLQEISSVAVMPISAKSRSDMQSARQNLFPLW